MSWEIRLNKGFTKRRDALKLANAINKEFDIPLITKRKKGRRKK